MVGERESMLHTFSYDYQNQNKLCNMRGMNEKHDADVLNLNNVFRLQNSLFLGSKFGFLDVFFFSFFLFKFRLLAVCPCQGHSILSSYICFTEMFFFPYLFAYHRHCLVKSFLNQPLGWVGNNCKIPPLFQVFRRGSGSTCLTADMLKIPLGPYHYPFLMFNCSVMVIVGGTPCRNYLQLT